MNIRTKNAATEPVMISNFVATLPMPFSRRCIVKSRQRSAKAKEPRGPDPHAPLRAKGKSNINSIGIDAANASKASMSNNERNHSETKKNSKGKDPRA